MLTKSFKAHLLKMMQCIKYCPRIVAIFYEELMKVIKSKFKKVKRVTRCSNSFQVKILNSEIILIFILEAVTG
jgi:hypothetical protein